MHETMTRVVNKPSLEHWPQRDGLNKCYQFLHHPSSVQSALSSSRSSTALLDECSRASIFTPASTDHSPVGHSGCDASQTIDSHHLPYDTHFEYLHALLSGLIPPCESLGSGDPAFMSTSADFSPSALVSTAGDVEQDYVEGEAHTYWLLDSPGAQPTANVGTYPDALHRNVGAAVPDSFHTDTLPQFDQSGVYHQEFVQSGPQGLPPYTEFEGTHESHWTASFGTGPSALPFAAVDAHTFAAGLPPRAPQANTILRSHFASPVQSSHVPHEYVCTAI